MATWNKSAPESANALGSPYVARSLESCISDALLFRLLHVLDHFQRPDDEVANCSCCACDEELAERSCHEICILSAHFNVAKKVRHQDSGARKKYPHAEIKVSKVPFLASLTLNLSIFEWALNKCARTSADYTRNQGAVLKATQAWYRSAKSSSWLPIQLCIGSLETAELD